MDKPWDMDLTVMSTAGRKHGRVVHCIIPTHNRLGALKRCLSMLLAQTYSRITIYVVNDGSDDGTGVYLASADLPGMVVIEGDGKLWWGGAVELGMRRVLRTAVDNDYILLLNDDTRFKEDFLSKMIEGSLRNGNGAVVAPQYDSTTESFAFTGYRVDYPGMKIVPVKGEQVDATVGRGLLVPMHVVHSVGVVNGRRFRHYMGDLEFTARIKEAGFPLTVAWGASIYSDLAPSDRNARERGLLTRLFHLRSKSNVRDRLAYFCSRGPLKHRYRAPFRMAVWLIRSFFNRSGRKNQTTDKP